MELISLLTKYLFSRSIRDVSKDWFVLTQGVCDGCGLSVKGIWDEERFHLCHYRLRLLTLYQIKPMEYAGEISIQELRNRARKEGPQSLGRITFPMVSDATGKYLRKTSWEEALDLVAHHLRKFSPEEMAFLGSGRCSNEANYLLQKLGRCLGTNNIDHCARY
jgi:hypothetical protein